MVTLTVKNRYVCLRWHQPMLRLRKLTAPVMLVAGFFARSPLASACAVCLTGADGSATDAYNWSVLFLMATPYIVGSCIAVGLLFAYRRALKRRQQDEENSIQLAWKQEESSR